MKNDDRCEGLQFLSVRGVRIALRYRKGAEGPPLLWLGGYASHMRGTKARFLDQYAQERGASFLRFDYSGHGESEGAFAQQTFSDWLGQTLAVYHFLTKEEKCAPLLLASSMGAWLALRLVGILHSLQTCPSKAQALLTQIFKGDSFVHSLLEQAPLPQPKGLLLLAPAPDFTTQLLPQQRTAQQEKSLREQGFYALDPQNSADPRIFTHAFLEDSVHHQVLQGCIPAFCPVAILQGMQDRAVPYRHALLLLEHLPASDTTLTLIKDADHSLSRPQDLEQIQKMVDQLREESRKGRFAKQKL